ncbi:MAG: hypothetical protein ACI9Y7_002039 [Dokdonia sp.]|jgi:hypothetical protein
MKNYYKIYITIIIVCISSLALGQEEGDVKEKQVVAEVEQGDAKKKKDVVKKKHAVIKIEELDQDGRSIDNETGKVKEGYVNTKIVDINSVLDITLDKEYLISKVSENMQFPKELSEKISKLYNAMAARDKNLQEIQKLLDSYDSEKLRKYPDEEKDYFANLGKVVKKVNNLTKIDDRVQEISYEYEEDNGPFESLYFAAADVLNILEQEVKTIADEKGVYVQFGGWIVANGRQTALNIPGFDEIKPQTPFEVERWQFLPTPDQLKELEEIQRFAKENKGKEDEILKSIAKNQLNRLSSILDVKAQEIQDKIDEEIEKVKKISLNSLEEADLSELEKEITKVKDTIRSFKKELNRRKEYYRAIISADQGIVMNEFFSKAREDISFIKTDGKSLLNTITSVADSINKIKGNLADIIEDVKTEFTNLKTNYTEIYNSIKKTISTDTDIEEFLNGEKFDFAALKFSEEVYKFTLAKLPESTSLDLINSGARKDGDQLAFKLEVIGKDGVIYSENRKVSMFRVLPHIQGTVGVIFADPLARTAVETQFQLAPYYNVIFKGFFDRKARRRSITYNRLLDWGVGLHVSAPDFDGDDVPELGAGVVLSVLNDYVQTGIAINVFTGDPYWFFGLRLPVPSFNIGTAPNNN